MSLCIRGSNTLSSVLLVLTAFLLIAMYFGFSSNFFSSLMASNTVDYQYRPLELLSTTYTFDRNTGNYVFCAVVSNPNERPADLSGATFVVMDNERAVDTFSFQGVATIGPYDSEHLCTVVEKPVPPRDYDISFSAKEGAYSKPFYGFSVHPTCSSDADCPSGVYLNGDTIRSSTYYCNSGVCESNSEEEYICADTNAQSCDTVTLDSTTYYCEAHGSSNVWLTSPTEFRDDLNDNDCDGVVERECNSCQSCTYELNVVAPSVADSGYSFLLYLTSDIYADAEDLQLVSTTYGSEQAACIIMDHVGYSAPNPIIFDGEGHVVSLPRTSVIVYKYGYPVSRPATPVVVDGYDGVEIRNVELIGSEWGADLEGITSLKSTQIHASMPVMLSRSGSSITDSNLFCNDSYSAYMSAAVTVFWVGGGTSLSNVRIEGNCHLGVDAEVGSIDFNNIRLNMAHYDYHVSPKPYRTDEFVGMYCTNGKTVKVLYFYTDTNFTVDSNAHCGYIINSSDNNIIIDLNGQTLDGFGIGFDSGNIVIKGPGAITGAHTGVFVDWYTSSVTVDLAYGDVNICGNYYDFYGYGFAPDVQCRNCGNGYYLRYSNASNIGVDCNAECLAPCS